MPARRTPGDRHAFTTVHDVTGHGALVPPPQWSELPGAALVAENLSVEYAGTRVLTDVSFSVEPSTLLAIIGPSGAGKSTLLRALTGIRAADHGRVLVDGVDLYPAYDEMRHRIGLVPQDDVLHEQLEVGQALTYAAGLRLPDTVSPQERDRRVDSVLEQLDLTEHRTAPIARLSGGQRKRASVAMELLTEPFLLYLDEPTAGLDPLLDREVMRGLRNLADLGRTVVVVTHSTLYLHLCHRIVVLARGGRVAYDGPPDGLLAHFAAADYADVFTELSENAGAWADRFAVETAAAPAPLEPVTAPLPPRRGRWRQFTLLLHRSAALLVSDRRHLTLTIGLPLLLAAIVQTVPRTAGLFLAPGARPVWGPEQLLVILVIGAAFMGVATSTRELVCERGIYHREWAVGLRPGTYLAAKLAMNIVLSLGQSALLGGLGLLGRKLPGTGLVFSLPLLEIVLVLALTAFAASTAGLLASALVARPEHTMPVVVFLVMSQLVLSGGLFCITDRGWLRTIAVISPTRWGYAAVAATVDLHRLIPSAASDGLWRHEPGLWWLEMAALAGLSVLFAAGTLVALRTREQRPPRRARLTDTSPDQARAVRTGG